MVKALCERFNIPRPVECEDYLQEGDGRVRDWRAPVTGWRSRSAFLCRPLAGAAIAINVEIYYSNPCCRASFFGDLLRTRSYDCLT